MGVLFNDFFVHFLLFLYIFFLYPLLFLPLFISSPFISFFPILVSLLLGFFFLVSFLLFFFHLHHSILLSFLLFQSSRRKVPIRNDSREKNNILWVDCRISFGEQVKITWIRLRNFHSSVECMIDCTLR